MCPRRAWESRNHFIHQPRSSRRCPPQPRAAQDRADLLRTVPAYSGPCRPDPNRAGQHGTEPASAGSCPACCSRGVQRALVPRARAALKSDSGRSGPRRFHASTDGARREPAASVIDYVAGAVRAHASRRLSGARAVVTAVAAGTRGRPSPQPSGRRLAGPRMVSCLDRSRVLDVIPLVTNISAGRERRDHRPGDHR